MGKFRFRILVLAMLMPGSVRSAVIPELADQLKDSIGWIEESMGAQTACGTEDAWYFRRFWLRLRPRATFALPGAKLNVVPEVELLLERDFPDGWTTYKP